MKRLAALILLSCCVVAVQVARAQPFDSKPRCGIMNPGPPRIIKRGGGPKSQPQKFIWAEFNNTCLDPVMEMGSYACLEEISSPGGPPKVVDCHANIDRTPFTLLPPHETNVYMVAKCDYTTVPRYYKVTGYAWAVSLPEDNSPPSMRYYRSQRMQSPAAKFDLSKSGDGDVHFCDISPAGTSWRNFK